MYSQMPTHTLHFQGLGLSKRQKPPAPYFFIEDPEEPIRRRVKLMKVGAVLSMLIACTGGIALAHNQRHNDSPQKAPRQSAPHTIDSRYSLLPPSTPPASPSPAPSATSTAPPLDCVLKAPGIMRQAGGKTQSLWSHPQAGFFCVEVDTTQQGLLFEPDIRALTYKVLLEVEESLSKRNRHIQSDPLPKMSIAPATKVSKVPKDAKNKVRIEHTQINGKDAVKATLYAKAPSGSDFLQFQLVAVTGK